MVDRILGIYRSELSLRVLILSYIRWKKFILHMIIGTIFLPCFVISSITSEDYWFLIFFAVLICDLINFSKRYKKEIDRVYKEIHGDLNYVELRLRRLRRFLREQGLDYSKDKLTFLIELVDKQAENRKVPFWIGRGGLIAIIVAILNQSLSWIFRNFINSLEVGVAFITVLFLSIIVICFLVTIFKNIIEEIINGDFNRLKIISDDLREIFLN